MGPAPAHTTHDHGVGGDDVVARCRRNSLLLSCRSRPRGSPAPSPGALARRHDAPPAESPRCLRRGGAQRRPGHHRRGHLDHRLRRAGRPRTHRHPGRRHQLRRLRAPVRRAVEGQHAGLRRPRLLPQRRLDRRGRAPLQARGRRGEARQVRLHGGREPQHPAAAGRPRRRLGQRPAGPDRLRHAATRRHAGRDGHLAVQPLRARPRHRGHRGAPQPRRHARRPPPLRDHGARQRVAPGHGRRPQRQPAGTGQLRRRRRRPHRLGRQRHRHQRQAERGGAQLRRTGAHRRPSSPAPASSRHARGSSPSSTPTCSTCW